VLTSQPAIKIGAIQAKILFAGLSTNGLYQFNIVVPPDVSAGDQPIIASIGGADSLTTVLLSVQQLSPVPRLTSVEPVVVYPDRIYSSSNSSRSTGQFLIHGADLASVRSAEISPATGITLTRAVPLDLVGAGLCYDSRQSDEVQGWFSVTFEVRQAPPTSPVISDVSLEAPTTGNCSVTWRGRLTFADSDGDTRNTGLAGGELAFIRLTALATFWRKNRFF
jgi:hypothetical protein